MLKSQTIEAQKPQQQDEQQQNKPASQTTTPTTKIIYLYEDEHQCMCVNILTSDEAKPTVLKVKV